MIRCLLNLLEFLSFVNSFGLLAATAVANNAQIYASGDYGVTWSSQRECRGWMSMAPSADSSRLVVRESASSGGAMIYTSGDYGVTWMQDDAYSLTTYWAMIVSSADGSRLAALERIQGGGHIFTSSDYGVTWNLAPARSGTWVWHGLRRSMVAGS
jgi:hypothetical protein